MKPSKDAAKALAEKAAQQEGEEPQDQAPEQEEPQPFEIFISRRFRSTVEAMSAARNALTASRAWTRKACPTTCRSRPRAAPAALPAFRWRRAPPVTYCYPDFVFVLALAQTDDAAWQASPFTVCS